MRSGPIVSHVVHCKMSRAYFIGFTSEPPPTINTLVTFSLCSALARYAMAWNATPEQSRTYWLFSTFSNGLSLLALILLALKMVSQRRFRSTKVLAFVPRLLFDVFFVVCAPRSQPFVVCTPVVSVFYPLSSLCLRDSTCSPYVVDLWLPSSQQRDTRQAHPGLYRPNLLRCRSILSHHPAQLQWRDFCCIRPLPDSQEKPTALCIHFHVQALHACGSRATWSWSRVDDRPNSRRQDGRVSKPLLRREKLESLLNIRRDTRLMLRAREQDVVALSACTVSKVNTDMTNEPAGRTSCSSSSSVRQHQKLARSILRYGALINLAFVIFWGVPMLIVVMQFIGGFVSPIEVEMVAGVLTKLNPIADVVLVVLSTGEGAICRAALFSSKPNSAVAVGAPVRVAPFP
eukprot:scaffold137063_cov72-Phaeocystis_antarctica.AAC.4